MEFKRGSTKHAQSHLHYCTEAVAHSGDFSVQSITLAIRELPGKQPLNLAHCSSKFAVLILVGQLATSYFKVTAL